MMYSDLHAALLSAWQAAAKPVFTVFDPDFDEGRPFQHLLNNMPTQPSSRLRYLAVTDRHCVEWPAGSTRQLAPGLNFIELPGRNAELHLWRGSVRQALQEFQGQFDRVIQEPLAPEYFRRLRPSAGQAAKPGSVAVVGAGIAGSSVALALCRQGIEVHLHEAADKPASGASGNWVGAFHPHITRGDSPLSQLSRLGFQHTLAALQDLSREGFLREGEDWATPGHLQTVPAEDAERTRETLAQLDFPTHLVRWVEAGELLPTPLGGLFFPQGGWVKPARWVDANLQACGALLTLHCNSRLDNLRALISQHDAVVVCCAEQSIQLAPVDGAQVSAVKGQISKLHSRQQPSVVLSGESYAIAPPHEEWMVVGATYERPVLDLVPTPQADEENRAKFRAAFPDWPLGELLDHRCAVRSVWHDRLPAIGPVPNQPSVYMSTGFASRGLLWAALGGWRVADYCLGQALESKLLGRIIPRPARQKAGV